MNERVYVDNKIVNDPAMQEAIQTRIECGDDFHAMFEQVCGVVMSYQLFNSGEMVGGSLERCRSMANSFELTIFDMLEKYRGNLYDFRFTFLDAWVLVHGLYKSGLTS